MNIVKEHIIFEKFTDKDTDPVYDLGIGLKTLIDKWIVSINNSGPYYSYGTKNFIDPNYTLNFDKSIDVGKPIIDQHIINNIFRYSTHTSWPEPIIIRGKIKKLPDFIKFNKCYGDCFLNCSSIISLRGCPEIVYGAFCVNNNEKLKKLDYLPKIVYGNFYAHYCIVKFSKEEIQERCDVRGKIMV